MAAASAVRRDIARYTKLVLPSDASLAFALSRCAVTEAAYRAGVPCPATVFVSRANTDAEIAEAIAEMSFPLVLRTDPGPGPDGSYLEGRTHVVKSGAELEYLLPEVREEREGFLLQEFVSGYGVGSSFLRMGGETLLRFAHRRLHEVPYTGGFSSLRASSDDPEVIREGQKLIDAIGYDGVSMVEFRRDPKSGRTCFVEFNGHMWGSIALALHSHVDFPAAWVGCVRGAAKPEPQKPYYVGLMCRNTAGEVEHVISVLKAKELTPARKFQTVAEFVFLGLDPRIRHDHFWWSDPQPGLRQAEVKLGFYLKRAFRSLFSNSGKPGGSKELTALVERSRRMAERLAGVRARDLLFVCHGNICSSPLAEAYWNGFVRQQDPLLPVAQSAGFFEEAGRRTPARFSHLLLQDFEIDLTEHRSRVLTADMVRDADAIFVNDLKRYKELVGLFPAAAERTLLLGALDGAAQTEIESPHRMKDPGDVRACVRRITGCLDRLGSVLLRRA
jgi:protein-tyrosine-phosphatase